MATHHLSELHRANSDWHKSKI